MDGEGSASIGIIGMGEMGSMYAQRLSEADSRSEYFGFADNTITDLDEPTISLNTSLWYRINACDIPEKFELLKKQYAGKPHIHIYENGHLVSRISDWIIYSVEAEMIERVVAIYGPFVRGTLKSADCIFLVNVRSATKQGAIVGGQTSCKAPEISAFEAHLPADVSIISCHSLHGPSVDPRDQPLAIIPHRTTEADTELVCRILSCLKSKQVRLSAEQHDAITADTQAVTHAAFLSMGQAWQANRQFPWELSRYVGGIENVKINVTLRIYSNKWHVYAGLAILNPSARKQIEQYAHSVTELFKLMLAGRRAELTERIHSAKRAVFGGGDRADRRELLLQEDVLNRFSLGSKEFVAEGEKEKFKNNHLSLLAMVDCWWKMGIVPYDHMICSTPLFRLWLGATEYLFRNEALLEDAINTAIGDNTFRSDDLEFTFAARGWSDCVSFGDFSSYRNRFEKIQSYFAPRFPEAIRLGNEMIKTILEQTRDGQHP